MRVEIKNVRNAQSLSDDNLHMDVEIDHPIHGWISYSITPHDTDTTIDNNRIMSLIGNNFLPYVEPTQEELDLETAKIIRMQRDFILVSEVDPIITNILRWEELDTTGQNKWRQYRQELLDVPDQEGFPNGIVWPQNPMS
tara:strand:+ start:1111 stop:1530 length:420 start_codon:yes stop_codon:yes gene_type:complete